MSAANTSIFSFFLFLTSTAAASPVKFTETGLENGREDQTYGFVLVQVTRTDENDDSDRSIGWRLFNVNDRKPAVQGDDFGEVCGTLYMEPTDTNLPLYIQVLDDDIPELDEDFAVLLFDPAIVGEPCNAEPSDDQLLGNTTVTVIKNDHPFGKLAFLEGEAKTVVEQDSDYEVEFTVSRLGGSLSDIEFTWEVGLFLWLRPPCQACGMQSFCIVRC
jgi:hypothetical protein